MLPKVNDILFIQVASEDEAKSNEEHKARIADIGEDFIAMEVPLSTKTGKLKRLYPGDQLSAYFITDGGVKNYFNTEVLGFREETIRLVIIKPPDPDQVTKVQRRNYLRVPAMLEVAIKLQNKLQITAMTDDVGGGGLSFVTEDHIPFRQSESISGWLLIHYRNGGLDHMQFQAEVVRIKDLEAGKKLVMCSFTDIQDTERQKVIRYCFERQLEFRKQ